MNTNQNQLTFYQFLNDDISVEAFENWIYNNKQLENIISEDYNDLIAFNFKSHEVKHY